MVFSSSDRAIVHIDMDTFFVSCERLLDSRLIGRPVLIGGTSDRGVVASCSYEARKFGIHSAMPMRTARQLCPHAVVIRGNGAAYAKISETVTEIIRARAPLFEKSSIDEFYIDVTGMDKFFGSYKWAQELREKIRRETGLPLSFGLSTSKTVSKISTGQAKPDNHLQVLKGKEKEFLAPLSIRKIPGVGAQTHRLLSCMGIESVQNLQNMSSEALERILGKNGITLWKKAQGIDNSPVVPYHERQSISSSLTFEKDIMDVCRIKEILTTMTEKLSYYLRNTNKLTRCVTVQVRYSDFETYSRQEQIPYTSCDHLLIRKTLGIFDALYNCGELCRLVGVRFSHLTEGGHQINLFDESEEMIRLYQAMDKLRNRFGQDAVMRAATLDVRNASHLFNPFNGQSRPVIPHQKTKL